MANVDNPHGLRPLMRGIGGGAASIREFAKVVGFGTALFVNDAVARAADGSINTTITPGTTLYSGVNLNYGAAATATRHTVIVSPDTLYEAQDNNDTNGFDAADEGMNCNLELNAGSAVTQISGHELDESTIAVTATLDVHMLNLLAVPDNAAGANARMVVMFNRHRMNPSAVGV